MQSSASVHLLNGNLTKVDHLISLVGGNPLPIVISALLLLKPDARLTLVHSKVSAEVANRIEQFLRNRNSLGEITVTKREVDDESNPESIRMKIGSIIKENRDASIGLDYTGGTKAMAASAYAEFIDSKYGYGVTSIASYLDPRSHSLRTEQRQSGNFTQKIVSLSKNVKLTLRDMILLHDWKLENEEAGPVSQTNVKLPEAAAALTKICATKDGLFSWKKWLTEQLSNCRQENRNWHNSTTLSAISLVPTDEPLLQPVFQLFLKELKISDTSAIPAVQEIVGKGKKFCEWLDGIWLEHAVTECLLSIQEPDIKLDEVWQSVSTCNPQFEVDVIASRGHQLFVVSCTTDSTRGLSKSKAFEVIYRARQLGGDEARVCLVCCFPDSEILEQQFRRDLKHEVTIIGRNELGNLKDNLESWIMGNIAR